MNSNVNLCLFFFCRKKKGFCNSFEEWSLKWAMKLAEQGGRGDMPIFSEINVNVVCMTAPLGLSPPPFMTFVS